MHFSATISAYIWVCRLGRGCPKATVRDGSSAPHAPRRCATVPGPSRARAHCPRRVPHPSSSEAFGRGKRPPAPGRARSARPPHVYTPARSNATNTQLIPRTPRAKRGQGHAQIAAPPRAAGGTQSGTVPTTCATQQGIFRVAPPAGEPPASDPSTGRWHQPGLPESCSLRQVPPPRAGRAPSAGRT